MLERIDAAFSSWSAAADLGAELPSVPSGGGTEAARARLEQPTATIYVLAPGLRELSLPLSCEGLKDPGSAMAVVCEVWFINPKGPLGPFPWGSKVRTVFTILERYRSLLFTVLTSRA